MLSFNAHKMQGSILLAVSGGVDSVVMASLAAHQYIGGGMAIAHCNFTLRGEESDGDEAFVKEFARRLGLKCFVKRFDTEGFARDNGVSIEMAARELRYRWFGELCDAYGFEGVCVAHNANDNAETLILNLLRGTGLRGICGMSFESVNPYCSGDFPETGVIPRGAKVFRPMLDFPRSEIEEYAREHGLQWREDSSNASNDYKRNIVRNEIFPLFEKINPSFVRTLNRDMDSFRTFADNPERRELVERMLKSGFNNSTIRDVLELLESGRTAVGKTFFSKTHVLAVAADGFDIRPVDSLGDGKAELKVELREWTGKDSPKTERGVTLLDADRLGCEPHIRKWEDGDYICPIGLKGRKKVSDILTELKYSVLDKKHALVVAGKGKHVLAIVGERVDESVKITSDTKRVYYICKSK